MSDPKKAEGTSGQKVPKSKFRQKSEQERVSESKLRMEKQADKLEKAKERLETARKGFFSPLNYATPEMIDEQLKKLNA